MSGEASGGGGYTPRLGSRLGRYRIESLLGRGGMGVVLLATDTELERPVALKLLAPELANDPQFRERFLRESRMAAAIEHPGIVPIYEAGTFGDQLFIAMRYVPGRDLASVLRAEAPLDPVRTLALVTGLAEALDAAHARGLVHRDVKPANVLLEPGDPERALLTDFGLTHRHGQTAAWSTGGPMGTLDYMAPELIERGPVDARADQYSLACLVFHCLAGSPPFEADSEAGLLYAQVHAPRPLLSERRGGLGDALDGVLLRGLARDPAARYADCRSMVVDAWRALPGAGGRSARSPAPSVTELSVLDQPRTESPPSRPPRAFLIGALAAVALAVPALGFLAASLVQRTPSPTGAAGNGSGSPAGTMAPVASAPPGTDEAIIFASDQDGDFDIYWVKPDGGTPTKVLESREDETTPDLSPDGRRIAYAVGPTRHRDLWVMNSDGSGRERLRSDWDDNWAPDWSPDGTRLVFTSRRGLQTDIMLLIDEGNGFDAERVINLGSVRALEMHPQWSPDGSLLVFSTNVELTRRSIATMNSDPERDRNVTLLSESEDLSQEPTWVPPGNEIVFARGPISTETRLTRLSMDSDRTEFITDGTQSEGFPDVSPDGSAVAFSRGPANAQELYVVPLDGSEPRALTQGMSDAIHSDWGYLAISSRAEPSGSANAG